MTQEQIALIRNSWEPLKDNMQEAGEIFYRKLFAAHPEVNKMFRTPVVEQSSKLMLMLDFIVRKIDRPEVLNPGIYRLGKRHTEYGALPGHYQAVGECLLDTLRETSGNSWNSQLQDAWAAAYAAVAAMMMQAGTEEKIPI